MENSTPKKCRYDRDLFNKVLYEIRTKKISITKAARIYNIPRTTILDTLNKKYNNPGIVGAPTLFTSEEETVIVKWILDMTDFGFSMTKSFLIDSVAKLAKHIKRNFKFKNGKPGRKWYAAFLGRHPEVSDRIKKGSSRRPLVTEQSIRNWFAKIRYHLMMNNLLDVITDSRRVFNCNETGFYLSPQEDQALVKKDSEQEFSHTANHEKECLSVLLTISADGTLPPPLILFPYKRFIPPSVTVNMPDHWARMYSEAGWMTSENFYEYITIFFHPWLLQSFIPLPVILFMDSHSSQLISINLSAFCRENGIILAAIHTPRLQPVDVVINHPLKNCWLNDVSEWRTENGGKKLQRAEFPIVLQKSLEAISSSDVIGEAFQMLGLYPFDEDAIDFTKLTDQEQDHENPTDAKEVKDPIQLPDEVILREVENRLPRSVLGQFKNANSEDDVKVINIGLYRFWKSLQTE